MHMKQQKKDWRGSSEVSVSQSKFILNTGNFPQIRDGNAKDLEQFVCLLDSAVISLNEAGKHNELGDGFN